MLRTIAFSFLIVGQFTQSAFAEDRLPNRTPVETSPFESEPENERAARETDPFADLPTDDPATVAEGEDSKWQPKLRIFINEVPGSTASIKTIRQISERPVTVFEAATVDGEAVLQSRTTHQKIVVQKVVATSGVTIIDCDDIKLNVQVGKNNRKVFEFTMTGPIRLLSESTAINAATATLKDGQLALTKVELSTNGVEMTSDEVVLDLPVRELRIGDPLASNAKVQDQSPSIQPTPFYNDSSPASLPPANGSTPRFGTLPGQKQPDFSTFPSS